MKGEKIKIKSRRIIRKGKRGIISIPSAKQNHDTNTTFYMIRVSTYRITV